MSVSRERERRGGVSSPRDQEVEELEKTEKEEKEKEKGRCSLIKCHESERRRKSIHIQLALSRSMITWNKTLTIRNI